MSEPRTLRDLEVGDLVVHLYGIGEFVGVRQLDTRGSTDGLQEFIELRYAGDDRLFVPVERFDLIRKYTGGVSPVLDRLGGTTRRKGKTRVIEKVRREGVRCKTPNCTGTALVVAVVERDDGSIVEQASFCESCRREWRERRAAAGLEASLVGSRGRDGVTERLRDGYAMLDDTDKPDPPKIWP